MNNTQTGNEQQLIGELLSWEDNPEMPRVLIRRYNDGEEYNKYCMIFNTRFFRQPLAIIFCTKEEHIVAAMKLSDKYNWLLKVRSGGHDHEGLCIADNALLADLSGMHKVEQDSNDKLILRVEPGIAFQDLVLKLDELKVCIPHGTCGTVNVAGFTLGGGWGPWTRVQGMCTEHLIGARIVLKSGEVAEVTNESVEPWKQDILWALRGGGGVSCGIVSRFIYRAFPMPADTIKFNLVWQGKPALKVLEMWEAIIEPGKNKSLIGTNLMVEAVNPKDVSNDITQAEHDCTFFGYFEGTHAQFVTALNEWFAEMPPTQINIPLAAKQPVQRNLKMRQPALEGAAVQGGIDESLFDEALIQEIEAHNNARPLLRGGRSFPKHTIHLADDDFDIFRTWDMPVKVTEVTTKNNRQLGYIPPDTDDPAPHKITSKVMKWTDADIHSAERVAARINVIRSLQSHLVPAKGESNECAVNCYATLGAITGPYYTEHKNYPDAIGCSMPYRHNFYTVQYQAWWNNGCHPKAEWPLKWIAGCREYDFPQTEGAFISFRDDEVPYTTYFLQNYLRLSEIIKKYGVYTMNKE
jgi:FAD/FMN-containing dehydrogenase